MKTLLPGLFPDTRGAVPSIVTATNSTITYVTFLSVTGRGMLLSFTSGSQSLTGTPDCTTKITIDGVVAFEGKTSINQDNAPCPLLMAFESSLLIETKNDKAKATRSTAAYFLE